MRESMDETLADLIRPNVDSTLKAVKWAIDGKRIGGMVDPAISKLMNALPLAVQLAKADLRSGERSFRFESVVQAKAMESAAHALCIVIDSHDNAPVAVLQASQLNTAAQALSQFLSATEP